MNKPTKCTLKTLKYTGLTLFWVAVALLLITVGSITTAVKLLTPDRLTPLVNKVASSYLDADVRTSRVELTFWSTFPKFMVEVDSLTVVSRSLKPLSDSERAKLPLNADSLASLTYFSGAINVAQLPLGRIALYDINIDEPMVNLVAVNDSVANFNIITLEEDTTALVIPDFTLKRIAITRAKPFSYTSIADSLQASITLREAYLEGSEAPVYELVMAGDVNTPLLDDYNFEKLALGLDGKLTWRKDTPYRIEAEGFTLAADEIKATVGTTVNFTDSMMVEKFDIKLDPLNVQSLLTHAPAEYAKALKPLKTDMRVNIQGSLTAPYNLSDSTAIPSLTAQLEIPYCYIQYNKADIRRFGLKVDADINGDNLNASKIDIKKFVVEGPATAIDLTAKVSSLMNDPLIDATLKADCKLERLPAELKALIPGTVNGHIVADCKLKGRQSYLTRNNFHKLYVNGTLTATDLDVDMPDNNTTAWINELAIHFGTSDSFSRTTESGQDVKVDSLLTASIKVDTATVFYDGIDMQLARLAMGVGSVNKAASVDTTQINPIGGTFSIGRLNMLSQIDSTRIRLREVNAKGTLKRFGNHGRNPQLDLNLSAKRISMGDPTQRYTIREGDFNLTAHLNPPVRMGKKTQAVFDSLRVAHPELKPDSVYRMARAIRAEQRAASGKKRAELTESEEENIDFGLDNSIKDLIRRWNIHGTLTAKRGRIHTPYLPLRTRLTDIDLEFSMDSVIVNSAKAKVGQSDFSLEGGIRNISRALTSKRKRPIELDFALESDTINVNELVQALFTAGAVSDNPNAVQHLGDSDDDTALDAETAMSDTIMGPLLIPHNITGHFRASAANVIYADLLLHDFGGDIEIYDGAISLNDLTARTDIGSIDLSALYSAPDKENMEFGFGMVVNDFHIERFLKLFPSLDTIMPLLNDISGVINADVAATTNVDTMMNLIMPTLRAAVKIDGDSLVLLDAETFRTLSKWLLFKNKNRNMIDHMSVEMVIENSVMQLFPFMFDIDRYRLGVMGSNDLALNLDYHISVLKSPLPFKFGINIKGDADNMKIRLGGAKFKENMVAQRREIVDTTRVNLITQMNNVFRRGVTAAKLGSLNIVDSPSNDTYLQPDTISAQDSLLMIKEGLITVPTP
ncbi:MAG: hypothetical protein LIO91_03875 [Bacteroidales bacterium]|nr:hypothetical protein [Bacteroidales bacterium]